MQYTDLVSWAFWLVFSSAMSGDMHMPYHAMQLHYDAAANRVSVTGVHATDCIPFVTTREVSAAGTVVTMAHRSQRDCNARPTHFKYPIGSGYGQHQLHVRYGRMTELIDMFDAGIRRDHALFLPLIE